MKSLFDEAERVFESPVHILVNSAAIADPNHSTISDTSVELFDRIIRFIIFKSLFIYSTCNWRIS